MIPVITVFLESGLRSKLQTCYDQIIKVDELNELQWKTNDDNEVIKRKKNKHERVALPIFFLIFHEFSTPGGSACNSNDSSRSSEMVLVEDRHVNINPKNEDLVWRDQRKKTKKKKSRSWNWSRDVWKWCHVRSHNVYMGPIFIVQLVLRAFEVKLRRDLYT